MLQSKFTLVFASYILDPGNTRFVLDYSLGKLKKARRD
jgi:hypothetical protein